MKPSPIRHLAAILAITPFLTAPSIAQTPDDSLLNALSLISGGLLVPHNPPPEVTHDGDLYHVRTPLTGLTAPPNASVDAYARPLAGGVWDITSLTIPPAGSLPLQGNKAAGLLTYAIGQQAYHGKIDPTLTVASPFKADFGKITLRTEGSDQHTNQTIEHYGMDGTLSGDGAGHMNVRSLGSMANWLITGSSDKPDSAFRMSMRSAAIRYDVDGLDRGRAERFRTAAQSFSADRRDAMGRAAPDQAGKVSLSPAARAQLGTMIDSLDGLLTRINLDETIQGVHFDSGGANPIDIGKIEIGLTSEARNGHIAAAFDIAVHEVSAALVPPEFASLTPRRIAIRPAFAGVRTDALIRWLHDAAAEGADPAALQAEASALLDEPGARAGIDSLVIESGPLVVEGSARLRPEPDGSAGFDIHLTARGLDAMLAIIQRNPQAQQILPVVFIAKGMAKQQGNSLVWDIGFASGAVTVNGTQLGQPAGRRAPVNR